MVVTAVMVGLCGGYSGGSWFVCLVAAAVGCDAGHFLCDVCGSLTIVGMPLAARSMPYLSREQHPPKHIV